MGGARLTYQHSLKDEFTTGIAPVVQLAMHQSGLQDGAYIGADFAAKLKSYSIEQAKQGKCRAHALHSLESAINLAKGHSIVVVSGFHPNIALLEEYVNDASFPIFDPFLRMALKREK